MSRIGKLPVAIPDKVKVEIKDGAVFVEGPKGKLDWTYPSRISVKVEENKVVCERPDDNKESKAMHGLVRALINNMCIGCGTGFEKKLEIHGVGFKAAVKGDVVDLALGYSHPINYKLPAGVKAVVEDQTKITISGPDKQAVGAAASEIRGFYPAEPYKGKGVRYAGEQIIRKEGKKV
ncbi:MAG: 50S ribosomal protein L6 [Verrucomicrobiales bacterium]|nr:50S ribosomal protein L6 [Verrucomicrobiales bacterium]|tara:strand:+ start:130 stop:663 length:534 start_codon:yes stop_codon:yes gene_type:complete